MATQRIRYIERPGMTIAVVQERRGLTWVDTPLHFAIDHKRAKRAMEIMEARDGRVDDTSGFGDRFKRFVRRVAKKKAFKIITAPVTYPAKLAHKVTHTGPLGKLHDQVQAAVGRALPFTKPFIKFHNRAANATQKAMAQAGLIDAKRRLTAKAIIDATKKLPAHQRKAAQKALVRKQKAWVVKSPIDGRVFEINL